MAAFASAADAKAAGNQAFAAGSTDQAIAAYMQACNSRSRMLLMAAMCCRQGAQGDAADQQGHGTMEGGSLGGQTLT